MKTRIIILLMLFSWNLHAQTENKNQIKIEENELGIGRDLNFKFKVLEPGVYQKDSFPLITIYKFNEQSFEQECDVISKHGKGFDIKILTKYQFSKESIFNISKLSNPIPLQYLDYKLIPEIRFAARSIIGKYSLDELDVKKAEKETLDFLRNRLKSGIVINTLEFEMIENK